MTGPIGSLLRFNEYYNNSTTNHFYTAYPSGENLSGYFLNVSDKWALFSSSSSAGIVGSVAAVHRLYRSVSSTQQSHFYTTDSTQISNAQAGGYTYEGVIGYGYTSSGSNRYAVYRYYSSADDSHWYEQRPDIAALFPAYTYKQVAWYSPVLVYACTDSSATNYDPYANQNSGCQYFVYGCTDSLASNYNPSANTNDGSCTYPTPTVSLTISPSAIIQGESSTISWSTSNSTTRSLTTQGSVSTSGSITVSPTSTTTYTLSASYYGYTTNSISKTLTVYVPPNVTLTVDDPEIISGESTVLRWSTSGDASTATIEPGIGSSNLNSYISINPSVTTTYTISVSGLGGADSDQVTVTVYQPPEVSLNGPAFVNYGESVTVTYEATNIPTSFEVIPTYYSLDAEVITGDVIVLETGDAVSGEFTVTPPWDNRGPAQLSYVANVVGYNGQTRTDNLTIGVDIDQVPDYIAIPDSDEKIRNQQPVISPDEELTTLQLLVDDIDIPVEIRSDYPIQVQIDNDGTWNDVRQI